jgi:hypothetical protein
MTDAKRIALESELKNINETLLSNCAGPIGDAQIKTVGLRKSYTFKEIRECLPQPLRALVGLRIEEMEDGERGLRPITVGHREGK